MECLKCHSAVAPGDQFCGECGAPTSNRPATKDVDDGSRQTTIGISEQIKQTWDLESTRKPLIGLALLTASLFVPWSSETGSIFSEVGDGWWVLILILLGLATCLLLEANREPVNNAPMYIFCGVSLVLSLFASLVLVGILAAGIAASAVDDSLGDTDSISIGFGIGAGLGAGGVIYMFLTGLRRLLLRSSTQLDIT